MKQPGLVTPEQREQYLKKRADCMYGIIETAVNRYTGNPPRSFGFDSLGLRDAHIPKLIELVNSNPKITNLSVDYNNIGNQGILLLARGLKYVQKLSLDATNLCDVDATTDETLIALAQSNIRHLIIGHTLISKENVDLFLTHSRQTRINLGNNRYIDEEYIEKAEQKAKENSAAFLKMTLLGESSPKRSKKESDSEQTLTPQSPDDTLAAKK